MASNRGFTLVEIVIACALATVVVLLAATAMLFLGKTSSYVTRTAETEELIRTVDARLTEYLASAINVEWTPSAIGNIDTGAGKIRSARTSFSRTVQRPEALAIFLREVGRPSSANPNGDIQASAIYFRQPTPRLPGELSFATSSAATGAVILSSDNVLDRFQQIVGVFFEPVGYNESGIQPVRTVRATITFRKFLDSDQSLWRWCPAAFMATRAECRTTAPFKDISHIVQVAVVNNRVATSRIDRSGPIEESLFGNLYFFKPSIGN